MPVGVQGNVRARAVRMSTPTEMLTPMGESREGLYPKMPACWLWSRASIRADMLLEKPYPLCALTAHPGSRGVLSASLSLSWCGALSLFRARSMSSYV